MGVTSFLAVICFALLGGYLYAEFLDDTDNSSPFGYHPDQRPFGSPSVSALFHWFSIHDTSNDILDLVPHESLLAGINL
jgi:hypothetical protein